MPALNPPKLMWKIPTSLSDLDLVCDQVATRLLSDGFLKGMGKTSSSPKMKSWKSLRETTSQTSSNILHRIDFRNETNYDRPVPCFQSRLVDDEAILPCKSSRHANFRLEKPQKRPSGRRLYVSQITLQVLVTYLKLAQHKLIEAFSVYMSVWRISGQKSPLCVFY